MLIRKDTWEKVSEMNSSIFLQSSSASLQSCHSPALHKQSHCLTISCGWGYKVYYSPAALFRLASCKTYLYSSDGFHLVVFVFWRATLGVNPECLLQSKMMNSVEEMQRKQPVVVPKFNALLNLNKSPAGRVLSFLFLLQRTAHTEG